MQRTATRKSNNGARASGSYPADQLMSAALELFSRRDFASVTIKDIASACRVNTALIYYYFKSKEDLFRAAIEFGISAALSRYMELRDKHTDPVDLINDWFRINWENVKLMRQLVKVMLDYSSSAEPIPSVEALIRKFYAVEERDILAESIARGIAAGTFRDVKAAPAAHFVSTHLDGIMVASLIRENFNIDEAFAELQAFLWRFLEYDPSPGATRTGKTRPRTGTRRRR